MEKLSNLTNRINNVLKPNLLLAGAGRSGSTFLFSCLKQHPQIYLSKIKELRYFSSNYELGESWYLNHFKCKMDFPVVGEASTEYLYSESATKKIFEFNPNFKIIFMFRNPVERAFSNFKREIQIWGESRSFEHILRVSNRYTLPSMYSKHISRFLEYFPKENLKVIIFEKFIKDVPNYLKEICEFLKINPYFKFDQSKFNENPSKVPISIKLQELNKKLYYFNPKEAFLKQVIRIGCGMSINDINHVLLIGAYAIEGIGREQGTCAKLDR